MGKVDTIDYVLAENLGKSLAEIRALESYEIEEWRAFLEVRAVKDELAGRRRRG